MSNTEDTAPAASTPFAVILEHLSDRGFDYTVNGEKNHVELSVWAANAVYRCHIRITNEDALFQAYFYYPIVVREKYRSSANELLTRANRGLSVGSFEFDFKDGEVRFRVSQAIGDFPLEKKVVSRLLSTALNTADRYFPALAQHLYAGITPEDAVYTAELDIHAASVRESPSSQPESTEVAPKAEPPQSKKPQE